MWDFKKATKDYSQIYFVFGQKKACLYKNDFDKLEESYNVNEKLRLANYRFHLGK